jgi:uncharacterized membrane protein
MNRACWIISIALVLAALSASVLLYGRLPQRIPVHWNIRGEVDGYGSRETVFLMPAVMAGMLALFRLLPWLSPKSFEVDTFERVYLYAMTVVMALLAYLHGAILWATLHPDANVGRLIVGGLFVFFILLGNVMGKVRKNFYIGIRTPWTLASDRVWTDTHRLAAWTMVASGAAGLVLTIAGGRLEAAFVVVLVGVLIPVVYSLVHYKRLERTGQI